MKIKKNNYPRLPKNLKNKLKLKWELKKKWLKKYGRERKWVL